MQKWVAFAEYIYMAQKGQWPLLLTLFYFNPSMDK